MLVSLLNNTDRSQLFRGDAKVFVSHLFFSRD